MRQRILLLIFTIFISSDGNAQFLYASVTEKGRKNEISQYNHQLQEVSITKENIGHSEISRHPFFNDVYKYADIKLARGRAFLNVKMRIDIELQQATFISSNGIEIPIDPGLAKEITYADTTREGILFYKFKTGFPNIEKQNTLYFYQVLSEGRSSLLKSIVKKVIEKVVVVFSEYDKEYETIEEYYLFSKGAMKKLKRDKEFILSEFSDKQEEINQYIITNKTNFKNIDQLIALFNYYNSL